MKNNKNEKKDIQGILDFISAFQTGDFSKSLANTDDPTLMPIVDKLNETAKFFADQVGRNLFKDDFSSQVRIKKELIEKTTEKRSKEIMRALDEHAIIAFTDTNGKIIEVNENFCKLSGYTKSELLGKDHRIVNSKAHPKSFFKDMWNTIKSGSSWSGEIENRAKDGSHYFVRTVITPLKGLDGEVQQFMVVRFDITEQKKAEMLLREQSAFINVIADNTPGMLSFWNKDLTCEFANRSYLEWFGRSMEEMQGITLQQLLGPQLFAKNEPFVQGALQGKIQSFERILQKPNGQFAHTWAQYIPHFESGKVAGLFVLVSDVTPIKREQEKLQKSEALNRSILNSVSSAIAVLDEAGVIIAVNEPWMRFSVENSPMSDQQSRKTEVGFNYLDLCDFNIDAGKYVNLSLSDQIREVLDGRCPMFEMEYPCHSASESRWFNMIVTPMSDGAKGAVISHINITEKKLAEETLRKAEQKLHTASKFAALGEMSAGIAHEINNPLTIIKGSLDIMPKIINDPEKLGVKIEAMKRSCERISKIVMGLRKFSRTGDRVDFALLSLGSICKDTAPLIEAKAKQHGTSITWEYCTEALINCNEIEVEQVLINLISNAIDAVKDRTERWVKVSVLEVQNSVVVRVMDSGNGIPESIRNKIFVPFYTTKDIGEGTGLGLSISKGIVEEHKATIAILADSPNTCFEVSFPKAVALLQAA